MTLMKKLKVPKILTLIEILLITTILFFTFNITNLQATVYNKNDDLMNLDYTIHDPIAIINDGNFSDYGFTGLGTLGNPYIIENYNITSNVYGESGILVKDTSVYFEIRNCYISPQLFGYGIELENILDGTAKIVNNTCRAYSGIYITDANNAQIINNTCYFSNNGIEIVSSTSVDIFGNNCTFNGKGISLSNSPSANIINNTCIGNGAGEYNDGIYISGSSSSILINNTCEESGRAGIKIHFSNLLTVVNNTLTNNKDGIYAPTSDSEFTSNRFYYNENGLLFFGQNTVVQDNLCIGNFRGIYASGSTFTPVINNFCYNNSIGIHVGGGQYGTIQDNICNGNLEYGIWVKNSLPPTIRRNTCNDNGKIGILIDNISAAAGGGTVTENICSDNGYLGLLVQNSERSEISDNTCTNDGIGIFDDSVEDYLSYTVENNIVNGEPFGYIKNLNNSIVFAATNKQYMFVNCHNLTIANHTLENIGLGIHVAFCYNTTLANNTFVNIANPGNYGIYLSNSLMTTIIQNVFNDVYCGAFVQLSYNTTIHMNWNTNSFYGFNIDRSANITLTNNMLWNSGIFMYEDDLAAYLTYIVENNLVNGNPLGYIKSLSSSTITGTVYGQLILVDCTATTVSSLTIEGTYIGLYLLYCDDLTIIDCDFSNNYYGIYLSQTSNCQFTENEINYNSINGIYSSRSDNFFTYNNLRENYEYAIYLDFYGKGNVLHHNNFYDNNLAQVFISYISQAYDGGDSTMQNKWWNLASLEGNYWSEGYDVSIGYIIDNFDGARYDGYPLDDPAVPPVISEFIGKNFSIVLVIPMFLVIQLIRKKRKNLKLKK